jgi:hypothetical protein
MCQFSISVVVFLGIDNWWCKLQSHWDDSKAANEQIVWCDSYDSEVAYCLVQTNLVCWLHM